MAESKAEEIESQTEEAPTASVSHDPAEAALIKEMMELGVFYGRSKARTNPRMKKFILTNRSGFNVIDLEKTLESFEKVKVVLEKAVLAGGNILLVGTGPSVKGAILDMAKELDLPYVTERWLGGTLTNFDTISKRIEYLKKLKKQKTSNEWEKYTKKEELKFERELEKLSRLLGGIEDMGSLPDLVFVADLSSDETAAREARQLGIPVVGILNTDSDPRMVDVGIPANEKSIRSAEFIIGKVKDLLAQAQKSKPAKKESDNKEVTKTKEESKKDA